MKLELLFMGGVLRGTPWEKGREAGGGGGGGLGGWGVMVTKKKKKV